MDKQAVAQRVWKMMAHRLSEVLDVPVEEISTDMSTGRMLSMLFALRHPSGLGDYMATIRGLHDLLGDWNLIWEPPSEWKTEEEKKPVVN